MAKIMFEKDKIIPNDERRIADLEKMVGARLPEDYRAYLLNFNGAKPRVVGYESEPVFVRVQWNKDTEAKERGDEQILHVPIVLLEQWKEDTRDIRWFLENTVAVPKDSIAIWRDPGGRWFLLGIGRANYGKVFYHPQCCQHYDAQGQPTYDNIAFVANSFTEFIQMIEPQPDDWDAWDAAGKPHLPL